MSGFVPRKPFKIKKVHSIQDISWFSAYMVAHLLEKVELPEPLVYDSEYFRKEFEKFQPKFEFDVEKPEPDNEQVSLTISPAMKAFRLELEKKHLAMSKVPSAAPKNVTPSFKLKQIVEYEENTESEANSSDFLD